MKGARNHSVIGGKYIIFKNKLCGAIILCSRNLMIFHFFLLPTHISPFVCYAHFCLA